MVITLDSECFLIPGDNPIDGRNEHCTLLESQVQETVLQSGWENFLVAIPFAVALLIGLFRLDQIIAQSRRATTIKRPACGCDEHGNVLLSDPDGRPWPDSRPWIA